MDLALYAVITFLIILQINSIYAPGQKYTSETNNVYYIDAEQKYSWFESLIACMDMNMTLVTIDTGTKSNEINSLIRNNFRSVVKLWIGGIMSRFPHRHFIWLATGKPFSYTNWQGKNPDFYGRNEYCAHIGWGNKLEWNDIACVNHQGFICEYSQQHQQSEQIQQDLEKEKKKLQQQLQQKNQKQQEFQEQMQEKQAQQDKLKQELEDIKEQIKKENHQHQQLQKYLKVEIEEQQDKLKQNLRNFEKLEKDLKGALTNYKNAQHELEKQENLNDQLQRELQIFKEKQQIPPNDMNKKYRDIILHFHQNQ